MKQLSKCFFISEDKWLEFAEGLAGGPIICNNGIAMFDSLIVKKRTNAIALSALTMHMCTMVGAQEVWKDFVATGLQPCHEKHDMYSNDWKPS